MAGRRACPRSFRLERSLAAGLEEDREEDKARSMPPITPGSLSHKAGAAPGATVTLSAGDQGIVTAAWVGGVPAQAASDQGLIMPWTSRKLETPPALRSSCSPHPAGLPERRAPQPAVACRWRDPRMQRAAETRAAGGAPSSFKMATSAATAVGASTRKASRTSTAMAGRPGCRYSPAATDPRCPWTWYVLPTGISSFQFRYVGARMSWG